ncbi:MAG: bacillithiol biosynthesis cysteine-adding enzyme BshC [Bacteroidetes bacterium]|nr:MAG: bacillithiol biosynthesis cysteine-adding enzyme BshC [Bacteroidota bacterium]
MRAYEFDKLPGFSKLFCDYINHNPFFDERFPSNKLLNDNSIYLKSISDNYKNRNSIKSIIEKSTNNIELNNKQKENLEKLGQPDTLTVVTGQQVGFLGGPLYTIIKIFTAINLANKLSNKYQDLNFIPVFWIEDNDHDNLEASQATIYNAEYELKHLSCMEGLSKEDRTCVSERKFDDSIFKAISNAIESLAESQFKESLINKLNTIYKPEIKWNDAFISLLNSWFADKGLLYIKASEARQSRLFRELILKELENIGKTKQIINDANQKIEKSGYHIQAKAYEVNVFIHENEKRYKIIKTKYDNLTFEYDSRLISLDELKQKAEKEPELFSPAVLMRPVFQDYILPTAVYIGGPSEIGYSTQIKELYDYFNVSMPAFLPRHSSTFINTQIQSFLEKQKIEPIYFTKQFDEIEKELNDILFDKEVEKVFEKARKQINDNYEEIQNVLSKIDATLIRTGASACHKSLENLLWLEKKVNSAQKRVNQLIYDKFRQISNYFFPEGTMQERMFSAINFMNEIGEEQILKMIDEFTKAEPERHYYLKMES